MPTGTASSTESPSAPVPAPAAAVAAAPRCEDGATAQGRQVAQRRVRDERDVAAAAAVAAVGTALGHVLLPSEAERAVAAASRADDDADPVVEHVRCARRRGRRVRPSRRAR